MMAVSQHVLLLIYVYQHIYITVWDSIASWSHCNEKSGWIATPCVSPKPQIPAGSFNDVITEDHTSTKMYDYSNINVHETCENLAHSTCCTEYLLQILIHL